MTPAYEHNGRPCTREAFYAIACDRKGYVPTHNRRFSQALTGVEQVDFVHRCDSSHDLVDHFGAAGFRKVWDAFNKFRHEISDFGFMILD